jgi:hypothetical protein
LAPQLDTAIATRIGFNLPDIRHCCSLVIATSPSNFRGKIGRNIHEVPGGASARRTVLEERRGDGTQRVRS